MDIKTMFGNAIWITGESATKSDFYIVREKFVVESVKKATLRILGLGFFHCYLNGKRVDDAEFQPLNSEYEPRENNPVDEKLSGFHTYVCEYDVTNLLVTGENIVAIHFGGGWYCKEFSAPKTIFRLFGETKSGEFDFGSSLYAKIKKSFVSNYVLESNESHDYRIMNESVLELDFNDFNWRNVVQATPLDTDYLFSDCPKDIIQKRISPIKVSEKEEYTVYDCGMNIAGYPLLMIATEMGTRVRVEFSEQLIGTGDIDERFRHEQCFEVISDGKVREVKPLFTWFGFRCFRVFGDVQPVCVEVVHAGVQKISDFSCDNPTLNWIHDTYVHTQLMNMHTGIPSDCPHLERLGYTGDGQLLCRAAMQIFSAKAFYKKWMQDIADGQDLNSGYIQYTAPYSVAGGGPGGWSGAIVEVPYQYYMAYGDMNVLREYYPNMLKYFGYLETHSVADLVTSGPDGLWCLGDWCTPIEVILPPPFVNTYFYIKYLYRAIEIAKIIGKENDIIVFEKRISDKKLAIERTYKAKFDHDFLGGVQAANAFALDIGMGTQKTYEKLVNRYKKIGEYDTGIFGTEILTRTLFARGDGQLAVDLLCSTGKHSFFEMKKRGATTLWEYWPDSLTFRSLNHPMFGAVVSCFYDYLLGIGCEVGGRNLKISPIIINSIGQVKGFRILPQGKVSVMYIKRNGKLFIEIELPPDENATFIYNDEVYALSEGKNKFEFDY